jgi:hypothetical protein
VHLQKYKVGIVPLDIFHFYQTRFDMPFEASMVQVVEKFPLPSVKGILYEVPVLNSSDSGVCQMRNRKFRDRIQK